MTIDGLSTGELWRLQGMLLLDILYEDPFTLLFGKINNQLGHLLDFRIRSLGNTYSVTNDLSLTWVRLTPEVDYTHVFDIDIRFGMFAMADDAYGYAEAVIRRIGFYRDLYLTSVEWNTFTQPGIGLNLQSVEFGTNGPDMQAGTFLTLSKLRRA